MSALLPVDTPSPSHVVQARRSLGMQDDAFSFCALVTTASRIGDAQLLSEVVESAQAASACNVAVCNAAIEAFGRLGNAGVSHASRCMRDTLTWGLHCTFHLPYCGNTKQAGLAAVRVSSSPGSTTTMQAAMELFEKRMPVLGVQLDIITYNSLLRALGRSNDPSHSAYVLCLYDKLCAGSGLTPDKHTFSALFSSAKHLGICDGSFLLQVRRQSR